MLAALAIMLLAAPAAPCADAQPPLDGTAWVLDRLGDAAAPEVPTVTLRFEGGRLSGSDGCNRYTGGYAARDGSFSVAPGLASTKMACPPDATATARAWGEVLASALAYRIADDRLELLGPGGKRLAVLSAQSAELAGTRWKATGINNGNQAVVSVLGGTTVTIEFGADGQAGGSAGCNR
jgi:heat shock protein HslJ